MKSKLFELLLVLQLISACIGVNPCVDYLFVYMASGVRSSDYDSRLTDVSICDAYLETATWYRFKHDAGNRLIERPVEPWYCGTQAPIWMNGSHPTDSSEVTVGVCATYSSGNICGWSGTVRVRLCNASGSEFFVYQLAIPPGCALAYCVDAASRKQCASPNVWLDNQFRCGENTTGHSTLPMTSTSSTERQSTTTTLSTPTEPQSSGWSTWGPWSVCSKPCDYGYHSHRRTCGQLPCEGQAKDDQLCNEYNCQKLPEEKTKGIVLVLQNSDSTADTMLTVVLSQPDIHNILRKYINDICSQNVSMCCGWQYNGISSLPEEFVLPDDIYPAQGSIEPRTDDTVYYQVIAIINEDVDRAICKGTSKRINARQVKSSPNYLSFDVMMMASVKSANNIFQETGLLVIGYIDPATVIDEDDGDDGDGDDYVLPIVICSTIVVLGIIIGCFCLAKSKLKSKTEPDASSLEPPRYEEISEMARRVDIAELSYIVLALPPTSVSHNAYNTRVDQESVDLQKWQQRNM